jgi:hypothetical protein
VIVRAITRTVAICGSAHKGWSLHPSVPSRSGTPALLQEVRSREPTADGALTPWRHSSTRTVAIAHAVVRWDDEVDALDAAVFRTLLDHLSTHAGAATPALSLLLLARSLERVAECDEYWRGSPLSRGGPRYQAPGVTHPRARSHWAPAAPNREPSGVSVTAPRQAGHQPPARQAQPMPLVRLPLLQPRSARCRSMSPSRPSP